MRDTLSEDGEADYWAHDGGAEWVRVDRAHRPRPAMQKRTPKQREKVRAH